eukprot:CAMPEP_0116868362 /NCGR_PEP_ID=MMETSP0418-20121206/27152_1 /TAXON_ID=1158023 /ORGANISM="Astrosyne radiata, Strain 13vi08-1A" /LENGTH=197 /DNA_ID=CAMNT_0004504319 /DNA_START=51 /DNA_END=644 /DNA_ORIENTATION=+
MEFRVKDATNLEGIETDSIDLVVSIFGVFLIPNQDKVMESIQRVLKPQNGVFANVAWTTIKNAETMDEGFGVSFFDLIIQSMRCLDLPKPPKPSAPIIWADTAKAKEFLETTGAFAPAKIYRSIHSTTFANAHKVPELMVDHNVLIQSLKDIIDPQKLEKARQVIINAVVRDGQNEPEEPVVLMTAANLIVARFQNE